MSGLGLKAAFARYGAALRNVQWSVSAWNDNGELVVSMWHHHTHRGPPETLEFADSADRWAGPGDKEFRENLDRAYREKSRVRLVIARTSEVARVEAGEDASKIKKEFHPREDLVGEVIAWDGTRYAIRFERSPGVRGASGA